MRALAPRPHLVEPERAQDPAHLRVQEAVVERQLLAGARARSSPTVGRRVGCAHGMRLAGRTAPAPAELGDAAARRKRRSGSERDELERALVGRARLGLAAEPAQEVGARGVQVVVVLELEPLDQRAGPRRRPRASATATARLSSTTGRAGESRELAVAARRSASQSLGVRGVQRRDRRLQARTAPPPPQRERALERRAAGRDLRRGPTARGPGRRAARARRRAARASRRESCSSISASSPSTSGSSGISSASAAPSRIASAASSPRPS